MSSTEERLLRRFFRRRIEPVAAELRARGVRFFATGPEPGAPTWYEGPPTGPEFVELEPGDAPDELRLLWESQDLPELGRLAGPLGDLAARLAKREQDPGDISPFIYVMY